jgi:hypothetical protein
MTASSEPYYGSLLVLPTLYPRAFESAKQDYTTADGVAITYLPNDTVYPINNRKSKHVR